MIDNAVAIIISLCVALLCPMFVLNGTLEGISIKMTANVVQGIGVFAGVLTAGLIVEGKKWITAVYCSGVFMAFLIACAMLFFAADGALIIWGVLSCVVGMICALFIVLRKTKLRKNKSNNRYSR